MVSQRGRLGLGKVGEGVAPLSKTTVKQTLLVAYGKRQF